MKKRLTALFLALTLVLSVMTVPVSAVSYTGLSENMYNPFAKYWGLCFDYLAGHSTYEEFCEKSKVLLYDVDSDTDKNALQQLFSGVERALEGVQYATTNVSASTIKALRDVLNEFGLSYDVPILKIFDALWDKFCGKNGLTTSDVDMKGYGAILKVYNSDGKLSMIYYGEYGVFNKKSSNCISFYITNCHYYEYGYSYNDVQSKIDNESELGISAWYYYDNKYEFIGDWRNEINDDDTLIDGLLTDPGESSISPDDVPEDIDLTDFLKDLLEKLMNAFPDTSTIEGLLRAILAKLDTLDSDNDNELLTQILVAIQALENNGQNADNSELVKTLNDLKNALLIGDGEETLTAAYLLKQLVDNQIKLSDITIDESLYNQRFNVIQARLLTKFSFFVEINDFVNYAVDCYKDTSENPTIDLKFGNLPLFMRDYTIDFSFFNQYIDTIRFIVAAFVYLNFAFRTFRKIPSYINGGDNT